MTMQNQQAQPRDIREYSVKQLRNICQATAPNPAGESKVGLFSRKFSIYFTKLFLYTRITPTQLNILSALTFFVGISSFFFRGYTLHIIGTLVIFLSIIFDGCDGEVARFRKADGGFAGAYNEPVIHDIQYGLMFFPLTIGLFLQGYSPWYLMIGACGMVSKLLTRLLRMRYHFAYTSSVADKVTDEQKVPTQKRSFVVQLMVGIDKNCYSSTGVFLVLFVASIIDRIDIAVWFFAVGFVLMWLLLFGKQIYTMNKHKW